MSDTIQIISSGGTIDKVYFDANSEFQVGDPQISHILSEANIVVSCEFESILRKDSLDLNDDDRQLIYQKVLASPYRRIIITHGTDTMVASAKALASITDKVVVFTGSMEPARLRSSDAMFNVGCAITAVQLLGPGIYIAMNGQILPALSTVKNVKARRFEVIEGQAIRSQF